MLGCLFRETLLFLFQYQLQKILKGLNLSDKKKNSVQTHCAKIKVVLVMFFEMFVDTMVISKYNKTFNKKRSFKFYFHLN